MPLPHFLSWGAKTIMLALELEGWFSAVFIYEYVEGFLSEANETGELTYGKYSFD